MQYILVFHALCDAHMRPPASLLWAADFTATCPACARKLPRRLLTICSFGHTLANGRIPKSLCLIMLAVKATRGVC